MNVLGFRNGMSSAEFLADHSLVYYLADTLQYSIIDLPYDEQISRELLDYSYNRRAHKMVASQIEMKHVVRYQGLVDDEGWMYPHIMDEIEKVLKAEGPVLIYSDHATIAEALARALYELGIEHAIVTGKTSKNDKARIIREFLSGIHKVLIGTATLATGTDGMDRVCDTLLIIDDTEDDALRRQLVGRIMPRGDFVSTATKQVYRLKPIS